MVLTCCQNGTDSDQNVPSEHFDLGSALYVLAVAQDITYMYIYDNCTIFAAGVYIYYETTGGSSGDFAQIQSPRFSAGSRTQCFTFWYYMYGQTVDTLNVYLKSGSRLGNPVWTRSHSQGAQWKQAVINLRNKRNIQVKKF